MSIVILTLPVPEGVYRCWHCTCAICRARWWALAETEARYVGLDAGVHAVAVPGELGASDPAYTRLALRVYQATCEGARLYGRPHAA
jgi:hypothetical protein